MRKRLAVIAAAALLASAAIAQRRVPPGPGTSPGFLGAQIDRMDEAVRAKSAVVRRDAFIVAQFVAALGELDDFQRSVALDKAHDHLNNAYKRAGENPTAPRATFELLQLQRDLIEKAKQQGATADMAGLKAEMTKLAHPMQQALFAELDDLRKDRQTLSDIQSRLSSMTNDMDSALAEALGSTFDYFKAGGR